MTDFISPDFKARLTRPVVLVGMMGVGKTRLGRDLAKAMGLDFVDSDDEIEHAAGMSVADIFERYGEPYFRDGERRVLSRLVSEGPRVIATGGGAIMTPETAELIWQDTISVWVKASVDDILKRTLRNREKRPLLMQGDPETILRDLLEKREPVYGKADITVENGFDTSAAETIKQIITAVENHI